MSDESTWRPIVPTGREDVLTKEFPQYLREAIFPWLAKQARVEGGYLKGTFFVEFQNACRVHIGYRQSSEYHWRLDVLPHLSTLDDSTFTNLIDFALAHSTWRKGNDGLEKSLSDGGSAWTLIPWGANANRLAERVPEGVQLAMRPVLNANDRASLKLQEAWHDAYGTEPRASTAYFHAVIAVEIAVLSVIDVNNPDATLASVFSTLESDKPKWQLIFRDNDKAPGGKTVAKMLRTLWRGHESRHGRQDYEDATLEEARAAVILAATLVQWFTSGVVVKVGEPR
ncbi:hypothetical protein [Brevibacterium sediminis]|uniref:hypothetical protein n=1 Tax=Brevibacterium sediminis TaxID=1857024 RepID=UPI003671BE68